VIARLVFLVGAITGCGFQTPAAGDAGPADGPRDGGADALDAPVQSACLAKWMAGTVQLSNPVPLSTLGSVFSDRDPYIAPDNLHLYFSSERSGGGDVYVATRTSVSDPFDSPVVASDLTSASYDSRISMTRNGLVVVESTDRPVGAGLTDLWIATRSSTSNVFSNFTRMPFGATNDIAAQLDPEINADGTRVYFAYGTPQRIVVISRANVNGMFGAMTTLLSGAGEADPSVSLDERLILFGSDRAGGLGGGDIWYTTRADAQSLTLATPMLVPAVNSTGSDGDPSLSDDGCTLYFSSFRTGNWELYMSTVLP